MRSAHSAFRTGLIVVGAGIAALALSVVGTADEGDFSLASAILGDVPTDSDVQSASGVIKTLHRLALEEGYADGELDALANTLVDLIADGIPPGTLLQVAKQLLSDLSAGDLVSTLEQVGERIAAGEPPGQVANEILGRGNAKEDEDLPPAGASGSDADNGNKGGDNGKKGNEESPEEEDEDPDVAGDDGDEEDDGGGNNENGKGKAKGKRK